MSFFESLTRWRVSLHEDIGDKFIMHFDCLAIDQDHAEEQAINAYPSGELINAIILDGIQYETV